MNSLPIPAGELPPREFSARLKRRVGGLGARHRRRHTGRRALALLAAIAVPAFATPSEWKAFAVGDAGAADTELLPMPFEKSGDSFPGSAFYYLAADPVPSLPVYSDADNAPTSFDPVAGPAARALRFAGSETDRSRALTCLTQAIYYEAASEPDDGQRAVAQVVLNRVAHPAFPKSVCGVVYQGSERSTGCQFSFTCDGSLNRVPSRMFWLRAENIARAALAGYVFAPVGLATHYHTIQVHPYWAPSLTYLLTIGMHRFYRLGGPAGASATFNTASYVGNEPVAAPRPRAPGAASPDPALDPIAIEKAYAQGFKQAQDQPLLPGPGGLTPAARPAPAPSYAPDVQARGGDKQYRGENLPQAQGIKPEYQNSGTWLKQPGT